MTEPVLLYLYGYPGVGKNTVAQEIGRQSNFIAIQNHLISNAFRHVIALQPPGEYKKIEPFVKHYTMKAWLNFLAFIDAATPAQNLIFTSVLYQNDPDRVEYFEFIRKWAEQRKRRFVPVRLVCSRDEIMRRAQSPNRNAEFKLNDPVILEKILSRNALLETDAPHFFELDITALPARDAAAHILQKIKP